MEIRASRPHMPGYGILPAGGGSGLLLWADVEPRTAFALLGSDFEASPTRCTVVR
jgi:hypothetical protein